MTLNHINIASGSLIDSQYLGFLLYKSEISKSSVLLHCTECISDPFPRISSTAYTDHSLFHPAHGVYDPIPAMGPMVWMCPDCLSSDKLCAMLGILCYGTDGHWLAFGLWPVSWLGCFTLCPSQMFSGACVVIIDDWILVSLPDCYIVPTSRISPHHWWSFWCSSKSSTLGLSSVPCIPEWCVYYKPKSDQQDCIK